MFAIFSVLLCSSIIVCAQAQPHQISLVYQLNGRNIEFPCESTKNIFYTTGRYLPSNIIPLRAQIVRDRAYLGLQRLKEGVPTTLGYIDLRRTSCFSQIRPFPNFLHQEEGNCHFLQSISDVFVDIKEILWALDTGITNTLTQPVKRCPPKLISFSLAKEQIINSIELLDVLVADSRLQYVLVDYSIYGNPYAYITDNSGAIIVVNVNKGQSYRIVLPKAVKNGCSTPDILYAVLVRRSSGNTVIFSHLCADKVYSVNSEYLQTGKGSNAIVEVGKKPKPVIFLGTDGGESVFFRYEGLSEIYMWDVNESFRECNFVLVQNSGPRLSTHVFPGNKYYMFTLESNLHDYLNGTTGSAGASIRLHPIIKDGDDEY